MNNPFIFSQFCVKIHTMKLKEIAIWIIVIAVLIGGLWGLVMAVNNAPAPEPLEITGLPEVTSEDFVKGATESAKVTLIEYGDFQCPACGAYFPVVKQLSEEFKSDLKVVYRNMPLTNIHPFAMITAQAAYAAGRQGKFWEMHDLLFENQSEWTTSNAREKILQYAESLKLDIDKFKEDLDSDEAKDFVNKQREEALSIGLNSTPSFFLNGKYIQNPKTFEDFQKLIQDEINKN